MFIVGKSFFSETLSKFSLSITGLFLFKLKSFLEYERLCFGKLCNIECLFVKEFKHYESYSIKSTIYSDTKWSKYLHLIFDYRLSILYYICGSMCGGEGLKQPQPYV